MLYNFIQSLRTRFHSYVEVLWHSLISLPAGAYFIYEEFQDQGVDVTPLIPTKYVAATVAIVSVVGIMLRLYVNGSTKNNVGAITDDSGPTDMKGPI